MSNIILSDSNVIFSFLGEDIEKKMINWDGTRLNAFIDEFSNADYEEMMCWSENHAFGSIGEEILDEPLNSEEKRCIISNLVTNCLMMATQGQIACEISKEKEIVTHFYNLWMAVNGGC